MMFHVLVPHAVSQLSPETGFKKQTETETGTATALSRAASPRHGAGDRDAFRLREYF